MASDGSVIASNGSESISEQKKEGVTSLVSLVASNTGMHGVPNIQRAKSLMRRLFWGLISVVAFVMLLYMLSIAIKKFYTYPTSTSIEMNFKSSMELPAITICNLNPIRLSAIMAADKDNLLRVLYDEMTSYYGASSSNDFFDGETAGGGEEKNGTNSTTSKKKPDFFDWDTEGANEADYYDKASKDYELVEEFMEVTAAMRPDERVAMGHNLTWLLLDCKWQGKPCGPKNFTSFNNYLYGNCFTFNSGDVSTGDILSTNKPGPLYGLSLQLYIEQQEYVMGLSDAAGVRVIIQNQTSMPFPEDAGFSIAPGKVTSVGLRKTEVYRAPPPWGTCQSVASDDNKAINGWATDKLSYIGYSSSACKKTCYQRHIIEECGCADPIYPFNSQDAYQEAINGKDMKPCKSEDDTIVECVQNVQTLFANSKLNCSGECPPACMDTIYEKSTSFAEWPSSAKEDEVLETVLKRSDSMYEMLEDLDSGGRMGFIRSNVMKLEVYFEDFDYTTIKTKASYGISDILSDIGGNLGLWLGLSIITVFEVVELFADIGMLIYSKCCMTTEARPKNAKIQPQQNDSNQHNDADTSKGKPDRPSSVMSTSHGLKNRVPSGEPPAYSAGLYNDP